MNKMKSIIIKQKGLKVIHLKRIKTGVDCIILDSIKPFLDITVILDDNTQIRF